MSEHFVVNPAVASLTHGDGNIFTISAHDEQPEILAVVSSRGPMGLATYTFDYGDAVTLRDWLSAWIERRGQIESAIKAAARADEWADLDPDRITTITGPGPHSEPEQNAVKFCTSCGVTTPFTEDGWRHAEGCPDLLGKP